LLGAVALAGLLAFVPASASKVQAKADAVPAQLQGIGIDQKLDSQVPLDLAFRDETGQPVKLERYFRSGRPVILTLVYYECPMLCTLVLNGLVSALRALSFDAGEQFEIITVSFDPNETPQLAAAKKEAYLAEYRRPGAAEGWHFLTGDAAAIEGLSRSVGFRFRYDQEIQQFAHAAAIMVLTPGGRVARYFYGVEYAPRDLRLGLIEAAENRIGSAVDQLLLYCFRYDPHTGKYSAAILNIVRLGGVLTVLSLAGFVLAAVRRDRPASRDAGAGATPKAEQTR
jgi:protein SCO1/2